MMALLPSRSSEPGQQSIFVLTDVNVGAGPGSATDSDAYVEMLQHHAGLGPLRQFGCAIPEDATSGADHLAEPDDQETVRTARGTASAHMSPLHHRMKRHLRASGGNHRVKLKCSSRNS